MSINAYVTYYSDMCSYRHVLLTMSQCTYLNSIVEDLGGRVDGEVVQRTNLGLAPTGLESPRHLQHVVSKRLTKHKAVGVWFGGHL